MRGALTVAERHQLDMLIFLDEGPETGWEAWLSTEPADHSKFQPFKLQVAALEREGCIVKTGRFEFPPGRKPTKHWGTAVWELTREGRARRQELLDKIREWSEARDVEDESAGRTLEDWIGVAITKGNLAPPPVWKEITKKVNAGELVITVHWNGELDDVEDLL